MGTDMTDRSTSNEAPDRTIDRRADRRLKMRLPVECRRGEGESAPLVRAMTRDICSRGVFLEMDAPAFRPLDRLVVELTLPPAEGVSLYEGRATCDAEVLRSTPLSDGDGDAAARPHRYGVAARFLRPLRLSY
jgi:hypothetical protein